MQEQTPNWWQKAFSIEQLDTFFSNHQGDTEKETAFLERVGKVSKQAEILDVCCGFGRHSLALAKKGYTHITAIDVSKDYIKLGKELSQKQAIQPHFIAQDIRKSRFTDAFFQFIFVMYTSFGYFPDEDNRKLLKKLTKTLRPDGRLVIDVMNAELLFSDILRDGVKVNQKVWTRTRMYENNGISYIDHDTYFLDKGRVKLLRKWQKAKKKGSYTMDIIHYTLDQYQSMFQENGLYIEKVLGNYDGSRYSATSPRKIMVVKKGTKRESIWDSLRGYLDEVLH